MEEVSGSEEMQIASKHEVQRKEYPIYLQVSTSNVIVFDFSSTSICVYLRILMVFHPRSVYCRL